MRTAGSSVLRSSHVTRVFWQCLSLAAPAPFLGFCTFSQPGTTTAPKAQALSRAPWQEGCHPCTLDRMKPLSTPRLGPHPAPEALPSPIPSLSAVPWTPAGDTQHGSRNPTLSPRHRSLLLSWWHRTQKWHLRWPPGPPRTGAPLHEQVTESPNKCGLKKRKIQEFPSWLSG